MDRRRRGTPRIARFTGLHGSHSSSPDEDHKPSPATSLGGSIARSACVRRDAGTIYENPSLEVTIAPDGPAERTANGQSPEGSMLSKPFRELVVACSIIALCCAFAARVADAGDKDTAAERPWMNTALSPD